MTIEKLELAKCDFVINVQGERTHSTDDIYHFMVETIGLLKFQSVQIAYLQAKVKQLEQQQTYYPFSEEELLREKVGGTD